jgi:probable DNA metabolism protein
MIAAALTERDDFDEWRDRVRGLIARGIAPGEVVWSEGSSITDLFVVDENPKVATQGQVRASRAFIDVARTAILHRDPARLPLLYVVLWRLQSQPRLLDDAADPNVGALQRLVQSVRRDIHKMRAFVRFRAVAEPDGGERYVAWFEPEHLIERANARFFIDRFTNQHWSILTPRMALHWDGAALREGPPASHADAALADGTESLWTRYYESIFNPARLKTRAMLKEMPRKYWHNLPEARSIAGLIAGAQAREAAMIDRGATPHPEQIPDSLELIAHGIAACRRCPIGCNGTRAVAGEGPEQAALMIVGEQPGDSEETQGRPFVGPAGQLLDRDLAAAGIERSSIRVTNAVKHFKFTPRGKRRLHQSPTAGEIDICRWWLDAERAIVRPRIVLALGASAGRAILGRTPSIGRERGREQTLADGSALWLTNHPSYLLRLDGEARETETARFADDLAKVVAALKSL